MNFAIVGSREYKDLDRVSLYMHEHMREGDMLVSGGAQGVDRYAEAIAIEMGLDSKVFIPEWHRYGRRAGRIRNAEIVRFADRVVAFWDGDSPGTRNTIEEALWQRKHLEVIFS